MEDVEVLHTFTRSELNLAVDLFQKEIIKFFGELWSPPEDAEYVGKEWICKSPIAFDGGIWRLVQAAKHAGAIRVFGKIEKRELGTILRFLIFYEQKKQETPA